MTDISPKAVRSRSRSPGRSRLTGAGSTTRLELDTQGGQAKEEGSGEPLVSPARYFNAFSLDERLFRAFRGRPARNNFHRRQRSFGSKNLFNRLPVKLILSIVTVITIAAVAIFYGETDGLKLVKRNAALAPGDRLKGGEYISFCTSIIATGCKPKYLLLGRDGSLGVYGGSGPHARQTKLWSAGMGSKGNAQSVYELVYTGDKVVLNKDGKIKWTSPVKGLPKNLQPWPFGP